MATMTGVASPTWHDRRRNPRAISYASRHPSGHRFTWPEGTPLIVIAHSRPEVRPIQRAVIHGFGDVVALDAFAGDEVGDRPRDFQYTVVGADGEAEVREGLVEDSPRSGVE